MPQRYKRSRSIRKVKKRVPGGRTVTHYSRKSPKAAHCSKCSGILKGIPRKRAFKMHKLSKTKKRPERPHGGNLCTRCMRSLIIEKARQ
jgi:large subunit ribosomal protein L34e